MAKFRKKPVVIEAQQWFPDKPVEGVCLLSEMSSSPMIKQGDIAKLTSEVLNQMGYIETLEGGHLVSPGDWIVTEVKNEKYPVKTEIFKATYDAVFGEGVEQALSVGRAVETLRKALCVDQGYHYSWQANIAMVFKDEWQRTAEKGGLPATPESIHGIANRAAIQFLYNLCLPLKTGFEPKIP